MKKSSIYEVTLINISNLNNGENDPSNLITILRLDGEDVVFASANPIMVYRYYRENKDYSEGENIFYKLLDSEIEVMDDGWFELQKKD